MAHFARVEGNNVVSSVLVVPDEQQHRGSHYLSGDLGLGGNWVQTSRNTFGNQHTLGGTPLRANFASIGSTYDPVADVFYNQKPYEGCVLNTDTYLWEDPNG
jgi:hypothetical protein